MADERQAGPYPITGVATPVWIIRFDKRGVCVSPDTQAALVAALKAAPGRDVIFISHGWQTDFADAVDLYRDFFTNVESLLPGRPVDPTRLLGVGITWPSKWFPEDEGPAMAGAAPERRHEVVEELAADMDDDAAIRGEFYRLATSARLSEPEAQKLARLLVAAHANIGADEVGQDQTLTEDFVMELWRDLSAGQATNDGDPGLATGPGAGPAIAGGGFDPWSILRVFSIYQMKDRAGTVGSNGVAKLLSELTGNARAVYQVGHSFGCKVMLSAVKAGAARTTRPKAMLLLQPAISHLCFSRNVEGSGLPGGYADVPDLVDGAIFSTYSTKDWPLRKIFHLALRRKADLGEARTAAAGQPPSKYAALGGYGPFGRDELVHMMTLPEPGEPILAPAGKRIVGLDGSSGIPGHVEVANPHTASALLELMQR